ncbi:kinase-like protein [Trametes punicea]|nr:kinase-like protein [Trametes punicea]
MWKASRVLSAPQTSSDTRSASTWEELEELLEDYNPSVNGYCPVAVGDILGRRYSVVRKSGWGVYSTVWLVKDTRSPDSSQAFAAAKLMTGVATEAHEKGQLQRTGVPPTDEHELVTSRHVIQCREHFYEQSPCGNHLCVVVEPLLQDLHSFSLHWTRRLYPPPLVRLLARQIVSGIQNLHEDYNIIHTDIKPGNTMMVPPGNASLFPGALSGSSTPETAVGQCPNGRPVTRVRSHPIPYPMPEWRYDPNSLEPWRNVNVRFACWADEGSEHFTEIIQSPPMRAPEVAVGAGWGKPADIWSLGCTLYELQLGQSLLNASIDHVSVPTLHALLFGDYPPELVQRGKHSHIFFNQDAPSACPEPFDAVVRRRSAPDPALFSDFLLLTFPLDPSKRATCAELLTHPWLNP